MKKLWVHILLFLGTFLSTTIAGVQWAGHDFTDLGNLSYGITYGILLMTFLSAHEFGHFFASRFHKVNATLPYYIPFPPAPGSVGLFGTFGAVIKTRSPILTRKSLFDIGVSGPIAGFVVSFLFLVYGLLNLPGNGIEFIYKIHPNYLLLNNGIIPDTGLHFGDTVLYTLLVKLFTNPQTFLPPMNEIYHYPFLNVGWFGLFVTTLNMIPIGQLDGGHIAYAMFGSEKQVKLARIFWWLIMIAGCIGMLGVVYDMLSPVTTNSFENFFRNTFLPPLYWIKINLPWLYTLWPGWLFWGIITRFFIKLKHPELRENDELDSRRKAIGWIAFIILFLSISYNGIYFIE